jgi:hypothetical protein
LSPRRLITITAVLALAAFALAACGGDDDGEDGDQTVAAEQTTAGNGEPSVTIITPEDGSSASGAVTVEVALERFALDEAAVGMANQEGKGHLHFSLDGGRFDTPKYSGANGQLAKQLGTDGQYSPAVEPTITYTGLPPGEHTLEVDLVNNDHSETGVSETVTFTVE